MFESTSLSPHKHPEAAERNFISNIQIISCKKKNPSSSQFAFKPLIPCTFTNAKALKWNITVDATHPNCRFSLIQEAFILFQNMALSGQEYPLTTLISSTNSSIFQLLGLFSFFH
jgi:hypothetical protein